MEQCNMHVKMPLGGVQIYVGKATQIARLKTGVARVLHGFCAGVFRRVFSGVYLRAFGTDVCGRCTGVSGRCTVVFGRLRLKTGVQAFKTIKPAKKAIKWFQEPSNAF